MISSVMQVLSFYFVAIDLVTTDASLGFGREDSEVVKIPQHYWEDTVHRVYMILLSFPNPCQEKNIQL